jgi:hypothetical protein
LFSLSWACDYHKALDPLKRKSVAAAVGKR